jgi:RNA polymerase sigma factor (sigma-70 family)
VGSTEVGSTVASTAVPNARELLAEFKATGDQVAFEEIVRRYAGMVFGVCLRTTKNTHDAEDATQAVFLSLAAQCKTGEGVRYVGPWLQQVAKRVSLDIKRSKRRREAREQRHHSMNGNGNGHTPVEKSGAIDVDDLKGVLGEELSALPSKYRLPLILHYFGGMTRDEMAKELNCKPATLGVRIHRGREMLGRRLHERGAAPKGLMLSIALAGAIQQDVSDALIARTVEAVCKLSFGHDLSSMIASNVMAISKSAAAGAAMAAKLKMVAAVAIVALLTVSAGGAWAKLAPENLRLQNLLHFHFNWLPKFRSPSINLQTNAAQPPAAEEPAAIPTSMATELKPVQLVDVTPVMSIKPLRQPVAPKAVATKSGSDAPLQYARPKPSALNAARQSPPSAAEVATRQIERAAADRAAAAAADVPTGETSDDSSSISLAAAAAPDSKAKIAGEVQLTTGDSEDDSGQSSAKYLSVGGSAGGSGSFASGGGNFEFGKVDVGGAGTGVFDHFGGIVTLGQLRLGIEPGSNGTYWAHGGATLRVKRGQNGETGIEVGGEGSGALLLGDKNSTGNVFATGEGADPNLVVRSHSRGSGTIEGWGSVDLGGIFVQNGQAIANGYGKGRSLDFNGFRQIINTIENPTLGGTHGWFATNGARLALPSIPVHAGTDTYTWGESPTDDTIDLVNSARITLHDVPGEGYMDIALLALDRGGIPPLPQGHHFIGIWSFNTYSVDRDPLTGILKSSDLPPDGIDLTVRYDDGLAAQLGLDENVLKLWKYQDGKWQRIYDDFARHPDLHILTGHTDGDVEYFAVSAPEPGAGVLLIMGGAFASLRRRSRRRANASRIGR